MTDALETIRAQIEAVRSAAEKATKRKEARRLRLCAAALERGARTIARQETDGDDLVSWAPR